VQTEDYAGIQLDIGKIDGASCAFNPSPLSRVNVKTLSFLQGVPCGVAQAACQTPEPITETSESLTEPQEEAGAIPQRTSSSPAPEASEAECEAAGQQTAETTGEGSDDGACSEHGEGSGEPPPDRSGEGSPGEAWPQGPEEGSGAEAVEERAGEATPREGEVDSGVDQQQVARPPLGDLGEESEGAACLLEEAARAPPDQEAAERAPEGVEDAADATPGGQGAAEPQPGAGGQGDGDGGAPEHDTEPPGAKVLEGPLQLGAAAPLEPPQSGGGEAAAGGNGEVVGSGPEVACGSPAVAVSGGEVGPAGRERRMADAIRVARCVALAHQRTRMEVDRWWAERWVSSIRGGIGLSPWRLHVV